MLGAGDDFLSGVAAFAEADAVQQIEIQHLRDEGLASGQIYLRKTGANVREPPSLFDVLHVGRGGVHSVLRQLLGSADDPVAPGVPVAGGTPCAVFLYVASFRGLRPPGAMAARHTEELAGV